MLTAGIVAHLGNIQNSAYIQTIKQNPAASKIGDINDSNTILNLNMPDIKKVITSSANKVFAGLAEPVRTQAANSFAKAQSDFSSTVTHAFSGSLQRIFDVASGLMVVATLAVFAVKERVLRTASPGETPGEEE
jgi:hypothetical protein